MQYIMTMKDGMRSLAVRAKPNGSTMSFMTDQGVRYPVLVDPTAQNALNVYVKENGKVKAFSSVVNCLLYSISQWGSEKWFYYLSYNGSITQQTFTLSFYPESIYFDANSGLYIAIYYHYWAYSADGLSWISFNIPTVKYEDINYSTTDDSHLLPLWQFRIIHVYIDTDGLFCVVIRLRPNISTTDTRNWSTILIYRYSADFSSLSKLYEHVYTIYEAYFPSYFIELKGKLFGDNGYYIKDHKLYKFSVPVSSSSDVSTYMSYGRFYGASNMTLCYTVGDTMVKVDPETNYMIYSTPEDYKFAGMFNDWQQVRYHEDNAYVYYMLKDNYKIKNPYKVIAYDPVSKYYYAINQSTTGLKLYNLYKGKLALTQTGIALYLYKWTWIPLQDFANKPSAISSTLSGTVDD